MSSRSKEICRPLPEPEESGAGKIASLELGNIPDDPLLAGTCNRQSAQLPFTLFESGWPSASQAEAIKYKRAQRGTGKRKHLNLNSQSKLSVLLYQASLARS